MIPVAGEGNKVQPTDHPEFLALLRARDTSVRCADRIALQIGPVVRGTALRDATGAAPFDQFTNQLDYADVSKEMNRRAVKQAFANIAPSSLSGKAIKFFGAFTFDPRSKGLILVTPVKVEQ